MSTTEETGQAGDLHRHQQMTEGNLRGQGRPAAGSIAPTAVLLLWYFVHQRDADFAFPCAPGLRLRQALPGVSGAGVFAREPAGLRSQRRLTSGSGGLSIFT